MALKAAVEQDLERIYRLIGNTPLLQLGRLGGAPRQIYAKAEFLNFGGSVKSRTAFGILRDAERAGLLHKGDTIVEASTGNQGIALAMLAALGGYEATIVLPAMVPIERRQVIEAYGARVMLVDARGTIRDTVEACKSVAEKLARRPHTFYARQFENASNPAIHEQTTGPEILEQLPGEIGAFVAAVGTGGTLTGVARALRRVQPGIRIVAVEPRGAAVLSGGEIGMHAQFGIGEGFVPGVFERSLVDDVVVIDDDEAYDTARQLARLEGCAVGISSGTNVAAALRIASERSDSKPIVTVLPDSVERNLSAVVRCP